MIYTSIFSGFSYTDQMRVFNADGIPINSFSPRNTVSHNEMAYDLLSDLLFVSINGNSVGTEEIRAFNLAGDLVDTIPLAFMPGRLRGL